ncbi:transglutaminase family protein [Perilla frutescens var. hirtella]|uniref:Transglutaminase family protein n=1 Tax=Perilla frutescens var. hirtella TaxID=608512 RepID=A0AAD4NYJ8_PERFH|nr:transglutaminase family protein [Perilla frutescens var. hirtella]
MLCVSLPGAMMRTGVLGLSSMATPILTPNLKNCGRYDFDGRGGCWSGYGKEKRGHAMSTTTGNAAAKKMRLNISPLASSALAESRNSSRANFYKEVLEAARDKFTREISFQSKDKDISLAKALLYVAAEDEAFLAFNREIDICSVNNERRDTSMLYDAKGWDSVEAMPMAEKNINEWLAELDAIAKEVEAELVSRDIGCHLAEVLEAVNKVLFESRSFRRSPVIVDSKCSYLHSALSSGWASAILLSVIYIEVCRRLNLTIVGARVGEEFLIWPPTGNPEELFKVTSGHSLFGVVNGKCVEDPRSKASDINSNSLLGLDIATNRDIIGIALANLIRLYWKRASRANHGLMLTSPLRSVLKSEEKFNKDGSSSDMPLLRPQELRLAIMASERLLILQPHNWSLRRDYGMLLYYKREYEAAVQELSICMAFAPEEEAEVLEPFVEKLHLMRLETSWKTLGQKGRLTIP